MSGGTGLFRFFAAGEWNAQQGIDYANERTQQNARTNLSVTPNEHFDLETNVGYVKSKTSTSCEGTCGGSLWGSEFSNPNKLAQFCPTPAPRGCGWGRGFNSFTPEAYRANQNWSDINRFTGSITAKWTPVSWMTHRMSVGSDYTQLWNASYTPYITNDTIAFFYGSGFDGSRSEALNSAFFNTYDYSGSVNLNVRSNITSKSSVGIQYYTNYSTSLSASGDALPDAGSLDDHATGTKGTPSSDSSRNNTFGFYGQQEFALNDRLFITGAARVDNNSAFGSDVSWVTYPKASLSWVASEEPFVQRHLPSFVDNLRIRAAYGASGQQPASTPALRTLSPVAGPNGVDGAHDRHVRQPESQARAGGREGTRLRGRLVQRPVRRRPHLLQRCLDTTRSSRRASRRRSGSERARVIINAGEITKHGIELGLRRRMSIDTARYGWDVDVQHRDATSARSNGSAERQATRRSTSATCAHRIGYAPYSWFSYRVVERDLRSRRRARRSTRLRRWQGRRR